MAFALLIRCVTDEIKGRNLTILAATTTAQLRLRERLTIALQGVPDPSTTTVQIDDQRLNPSPSSARIPPPA